MRAIHFPEETDLLNSPMAGTPGLPVFKHQTAYVSRWRPSWRERLSILFFGRVWLHVHAKKTHPACALTARRSYFETKRIEKNGQSARRSKKAR